MDDTPARDPDHGAFRFRVAVLLTAALPLARLLLYLLVTTLHCEISMLFVVELDGRPWWNSASIETAKTLAAPYIQHGRHVVIRSHALQREKVTLAYDHSQGQWQDVRFASCAVAV